MVKEIDQVTQFINSETNFYIAFKTIVPSMGRNHKMGKAYSKTALSLHGMSPSHIMVPDLTTGSTSSPASS